MAEHAAFDTVLDGEIVDPEDVPLGETVWIARHQDLQFDARADAAETILLANGVDTSEFVSAELVVVLHRAKEWASDAALRIGVQAVSLDPVEPDVEFLGPAFELGFTMSNQPPLSVAALGTPPSMVRVYVTWLQGRTEASGAQFVTLSVALNLRRHIPRSYQVIAGT
jgi:hypothetical protein